MSLFSPSPFTSHFSGEVTNLTNRVNMAVEAAVNRLEALVQKVDSDLNYAVLKLENEFSNSFDGVLPNRINPVSLIERLQKAKINFKILMKENDEREEKQKALSQELCSLTSEQMSTVHELQLKAGMQPSKQNNEDDILLLQQDYNEPTDENKNSMSSTLHSVNNDFQAVTDEEFLSISDLVRGRSKLQDVNQVYGALFTYFQKHPKASCLTVKEMTKLGLKVSGATGSAKLKVLRTLNIIEMGKDGSVKML